MDGLIKTPFTSVVVGPSGSGKSTFVVNLIKNQDRLLTKPFQYIYVFIGTRKSENPLFDLISQNNDPRYPVHVFEVNILYPTKDDLKTQFPRDLDSLVKGHNKKQQTGCLIFDDLMDELSQCNILTKLFTRTSTHQNVSIIHITQNLFHKSKSISENTTVFRNTKMLVFFKSPMDRKPLSTIAQRMNPGGPNDYRKLLEMLSHVVDQYRYVVIFGDYETPAALRYRTDIFATEPFPHQKIFSI